MSQDRKQQCVSLEEYPETIHMGFTLRKDYCLPVEVRKPKMDVQNLAIVKAGTLGEPIIFHAHKGVCVQTSSDISLFSLITGNNSHWSFS